MFIVTHSVRETLIAEGGLMQGDKSVIAHLNKVLTSELTSINQFFLHARLFRHKGLNKLNDKEPFAEGWVMKIN